MSKAAPKTGLSKKQQDNLLVFMASQKELQKIDSEFPLQYSICLTEIALNPGISLTALAEKTGMPLSTVSRIIGALSKKRQRGKPYELVQVTVSPEERRRKQIELTPHGRDVMANIAEIIKSAARQNGKAA